MHLTLFVIIWFCFQMELDVMCINSEQPKEPFSVVTAETSISSDDHSQSRHSYSEQPDNAHAEAVGVSEYYRFNIHRYLYG